MTKPKRKPRLAFAVTINGNRAFKSRSMQDIGSLMACGEFDGLKLGDAIYIEVQKATKDSFDGPEWEGVGSNV